MNVPDDRRYTQDHEWAQLDGAATDSMLDGAATGAMLDGAATGAVAGIRVRVGITDYAQDALGDVVFVQVPRVGAAVDAGATMGEVESTKSVSDLYAPVSGTVVEVNEALTDGPDRLNDDPYGEGWICVIEAGDGAAYESLLDAEAYGRLIAE